MTPNDVSLRVRARRAVKRMSRAFGYDVVRADRVWDLERTLGRIGPRHQVATVIDIGASDGRWSLDVLRYFPEAQFLLIEAQEAPHAKALKLLSDGRESFHVVLAAAGDRVGETHFLASDPFGGVASDKAFAHDDIVVPMTTVDLEVERLGLPPPYFLKLDTHGSELAVFAGAQRTLTETAVLEVEAYNFELRPGSLRFHELVGYLEERGLRCIDLADPLARPADGVLWQLDLFFAPSSRPEFLSTDYR